MKLVNLTKAKNYDKAFLSGTLPCPQLGGFKTGWETFLQGASWWITVSLVALLFIL